MAEPVPGEDGDAAASASNDDSREPLQRQRASSPLVPAAAPLPLPLPDLCARVHGRISAFLAHEAPTARLRALQQQVRVSLGVVDEAVARYSLPELSLSYNGGKDCLVLLVLYLCVLHSAVFSRPRPSSTSSSSSAAAVSSLQSVYIQAAHPFAEVEAFVARSVRACSLGLATYAKPMKAAFADYLRDRPAVRAIFVGTRRTDPHGELLTHFDPTDHGWPDFMRVHPVIDWHYVEIWTFIRYFNIPYCSLYDQGYTSLGGTTDTHPNPALRRNPDDPSAGYRPAYELVEDEEERLGRDR